MITWSQRQSSFGRDRIETQQFFKPNLICFFIFKRNGFRNKHTNSCVKKDHKNLNLEGLPFFMTYKIPDLYKNRLLITSLS